MEDKKWCVYMHINKINNKKYIGITSERNPKTCWRNGYGYKPDKNKNQNIAFWNAIQKYGLDNFNHIILINNISENEAKKLEKYYIKKYETFIGYFDKKEDRKGYNSTLGGDGTAGICGEHHHNYGKHLTEEQKKNISIHNSNAISEYDMNGILIKQWNSEKEVCDTYGINYKTLWEIIHGRRTISWKGKIFRYKNDPFNKYRTERMNLSGENHPMYGKRHTEYSVEKMKKNRKGKATGQNNANSQKVICDGIVFSCIRECKEYLGVPYTTLQCWLSGRNQMPEEYKNRGLKKLIER